MGKETHTGGVELAYPVSEELSKRLGVSHPGYTVWVGIVVINSAK